MLWLLYGSAAAPLHGNCLPWPIGCQTGQPCLGWRGKEEAMPWPWDVIPWPKDILSSPCPKEEAEERRKGKRWDENIFISGCLVLAVQTLQC